MTCQPDGLGKLTSSANRTEAFGDHDSDVQKIVREHGQIVQEMLLKESNVCLLLDKGLDTSDVAVLIYKGSVNTVNKFKGGKRDYSRPPRLEVAADSKILHEAQDELSRDLVILDGFVTSRHLRSHETDISIKSRAKLRCPALHWRW
jgi:hypothetical protein